MAKELDDELQTALHTIVQTFEMDERAVRERQLRLWKKLEYYWSGFTRLWWDDTAHNWRLPDDNRYDDNESMASYYDKQINVYRAYLESIIAALSATVPRVDFFPEDADNELDILTARGASKISELIYEHNDSELLWIRALYIYCTQGMIAAYQRSIEDKEYGTVKVQDYEDTEEEIESQFCSQCGTDLTQFQDQPNAPTEEQEEDEYDPGDDDAKLHSDLNDGKVFCPNCMINVDPELRKEKFIVPRLTGIINKNKARQIITLEGGLYVSVPNWARKQCDCPYLGYSYETHYTNVLRDYPHLRKEAIDKGVVSGLGGVETYARWARLSPQYYGEYPKSTPTVRHYWLRPSAFSSVDEDVSKKLLKKFPDGCHCTWINEEFADACNESLDDHWTLTFNPLSEHLHHDPLGILLTSIQEITQDLVSLTLQTIEHGVPQVFADPKVLNFNQYGQSEIAPGSIIPAKPQGGKGLGDAFYMIATATLSQEVEPFSNQVQSFGQFVSGAMPSIWGGAEAGGTSRTAAQANMSRNQSLQRLQTTWKMLNAWWSKIFEKAVPAYVKGMLEDESFVTKQYGTYVNDWIRRSEMEGRIGSVRSESSDQIPHTWGQVKDTIMQLIQTNNPEILQALGYPANLGVLQKAIGLDDFVVPGEPDREKQYSEIILLLKSGPLPNPQVDPTTGQPGEPQPSVMPEFEVDNHQVEGEICREWLVSEQGRLAKAQNPEGYQNVLLHLKVHTQMNQQLQTGPVQVPNPPMPQGNPGPPKLRPVAGPNG